MNTTVMQRCASMVLCAAILSGCAHELWGFSTWDGSPTAATLEQAEQGRIKYLTALSAMLASVPPSGLSPLAKAGIGEVLLKFRDLNSVTQMGVSYVEYPGYVRAVQFSLNRFPVSVLEDRMLMVIFQNCLEPYLHAQTQFSAAIEYRDGTHGRAKHSFYLRQYWQMGREAIALLEAHFLNQK